MHAYLYFPPGCFPCLFCNKALGYLWERGGQGLREDDLLDHHPAARTQGDGGRRQPRGDAGRRRGLSPAGGVRGGHRHGGPGRPGPHCRRRVPGLQRGELPRGHHAGEIQLSYKRIYQLYQHYSWSLDCCCFEALSLSMYISLLLKMVLRYTLYVFHFC
ncbi:unnamed protein product [Heterosigma akashiwo]